MYGIYSGGTLNRIRTFFSQILKTISLLVIFVVDAAAVAVVVVVVVAVFDDTGFVPLEDTVMIPISHPIVCLVDDVTMMSSGLWLLGNNLGWIKQESSYQTLQLRLLHVVKIKNINH